MNTVDHFLVKYIGPDGDPHTEKATNETLHKRLVYLAEGGCDYIQVYPIAPPQKCKIGEGEGCYYVSLPGFDVELEYCACFPFADKHDGDLPEPVALELAETCAKILDAKILSCELRVGTTGE